METLLPAVAEELLKEVKKAFVETSHRMVNAKTRTWLPSSKEGTSGCYATSSLYILLVLKKIKLCQLVLTGV
ncbi:hypothetical protein NDU88_002807 [Pleurodeles waltl]|uniref:Uncharacterized protein n=1 Tax=Pleurodeles waltl TaxID=8319 RepID=A0AAV7UAB4_PLEWA|nr:hypothetical protein NDU88_002807 [Pleurodeles waltl]